VRSLGLRWREKLTPSNRADNHEWLGADSHLFRERGVSRFERKILAAGEEAHERPAFLGNVISYSPAQGGVFGLERVEDRALGDGAFHSQFDFAVYRSERAEVEWKQDADHAKLSLSSEV